MPMQYNRAKLLAKLATLDPVLAEDGLQVLAKDVGFELGGNSALSQVYELYDASVAYMDVEQAEDLLIGLGYTLIEPKEAGGA